ncbi:MAG: DUF1614 domain-containing protein [Thermoplasmatota archaeon]
MPPARDLLFLPIRAFMLLPFLALLLLVAFAAVRTQEALGFSSVEGLAALGAILVGSVVNLPLYEVEAIEIVRPPVPFFYFFGPPFAFRRISTIVAVNAGGALIPAALSLWFLAGMSTSLVEATLLGFVVTAVIAWVYTTPVPGLGFTLPTLLPPLVAVLATAAAISVMGLPLALLPRSAFAAGVLGVLVGADVLHLGEVPELGAGVVSIGGAGTFDGIFVTGVLAALLAPLLH